MKRLHQLLLIGSLLPLCWLAMMVVHESGHVLGVWLTGGQVAKIVLHPLAISRTDASFNPQPLIFWAAGPVWGALVPLAAWLIARLTRMPGAYLLRFFAGFCLIANGAYLAVGSFDKIGDAGELLKNGAHQWQLLVFGAVTCPLGFYLWHNEGSHFGLGKAKGGVEPLASYVTLALLTILVVLELVFGGE